MTCISRGRCTIGASATAEKSPHAPREGLRLIGVQLERGAPAGEHGDDLASERVGTHGLLPYPVRPVLLWSDLLSLISVYALVLTRGQLTLSLSPHWRVAVGGCLVSKVLLGSR